MISEKFTQMSRAIEYPKEDSNDAEANEIKRLEEKLSDMKESRKERLRNLKREYQEKQLNNDEQFKRALFVEYGMENHRNRHNIFNKAWQDGHSDGYSSVEQHFAELVELLE